MPCGKTRWPVNAIAAALYTAGFRGNALVNQTAINLDESCGGFVDAHNEGTPAVPEDSYGLGQINILAHPRYGALARNGGLFNPFINARAQWEISSGGTDISPWSTSGAVLAGTSPSLGQARAAAQTVTESFNAGKHVNWFGFEVPLPGAFGNLGIGEAQQKIGDTLVNSNPIKSIDDLAKRIGGIVFDKANWWRVLLVGGGMTLVLVGTLVYVRQPAERLAGRVAF